MKNFAVGGLLSAALIASTPVLASAEELTVANFTPPQHHTNWFLFGWFGEELEKRSGGDLTLRVFPSGQLGAGPVQQYRRAIEGVADIAFGLQAYTPTLFPRTMMIIPPGNNETSAEATRALLRVYDDYLAQEYEDVHVLGIFTVAGEAWAATRDVSTMEGLAGAKMVPYAAMTTPIVEAMGAVPVQMPVTEMYTGLSTGTIDAATAGYSNMTPPWNFWEVADYFVENIPIQFAVFFVVMNKERYASLSPEHRAIIDELSGETFSMMGAQSFQQAEDAAQEAMKTADQMQRVAWIHASDEDRAAMDAAVAEGLETIFADLRDRGIADAQEIYEAMNAE